MIHYLYHFVIFILMKESREHLIIKKELEAIKALLHDLTDRFNKLEYSGEVEFGEPYNVGPVSYTHLTLPTNREV